MREGFWVFAVVLLLGSCAPRLGWEMFGVKPLGVGVAQAVMAAALRMLKAMQSILSSSWFAASPR